MRRPPPIDVAGLARQLGIRVVCQPLGDLAGKIEHLNQNGQYEYVITLNSKHSDIRQRFTLAHEIAHYIKHRHRLEQGSIIDGAMYRSALPEPLETEANMYAAQLLMPFSAMMTIWNNGARTAAEFACRLGVSEPAAEIRLNQLIRNNLIHIAPKSLGRA
jgi:Zn-dependent peptidase ImmA (M78 family)